VDILPGCEGHVGARRRTIGCSSKPFSPDFAPASRGAIWPSALATGRSSISASTDGPRAAFSSGFLPTRPSTPTPSSAPSTLERARQSSHRKTPRPCDFALYCERNLIERFFNKLKRRSLWRRVGAVRLPVQPQRRAEPSYGYGYGGSGASYASGYSYGAPFAAPFNAAGAVAAAPFHVVSSAFGAPYSGHCDIVAGNRVCFP
jgi:hypothetical protein